MSLEVTPLTISLILWIGFGKLVIGSILQLVAKTSYIQEHRVLAMNFPRGQRREEIRNSWHVISDGVMVTGLIAAGAFYFSESSYINHFTTFIVMWIWVEIWYYFSHRAMHENNYLYKIHKKHHDSVVLQPLSAISMSATEKWFFYSAAWLGFMALVSRIIPVTLEGIAAFYTFNFILSLHGHSNAETSRMMIWISRLGFASSTSHALHHTRYNANYCFSWAFLDKLFGTDTPDYKQIQENAYHGKGAVAIKDLEKRKGVHHASV